MIRHATTAEVQTPVAGQNTFTQYHAIEFLTAESPEDVFARYLPTFAGIRQGTNGMARVISPLPVIGVCDVVTFRMNVFLLDAVNGAFSVAITQFAPTTLTLSAVTLDGHPIAGWRYWRVYSDQPGHVWIETGAHEGPGPGPLNFAGYYAFTGVQLNVWYQYMSYIVRDMLSRGGNTYVTGAGNLHGEWAHDAADRVPHIVYDLPTTCEP